MSRQIPRATITLPNGASAAVDGTTFNPNKGIYNGTICLLKVVTPNFTNAITVTVGVYDLNGINKWTSGALTETSGAAGHSIPCSIPVCNGDYYKVTPSGDPGAGGGNVTIDAEYIPDNPNYLA